MTSEEIKDKFNDLLNQAMVLAKQYDELHSEMQVADVDTGPFAVIPDDYCTVPLIDDSNFTKEQIALMETALLKRAKQQDIGNAGVSFLKLFLSLLQVGIKFAT